MARIEIRTQPAQSAWLEGVTIGVRNDRLNARNPFAPELVGSSLGKASWTLDGPLVSGRTSLSASVSGRTADAARTVLAVLPQGVLHDVILEPSRRFDLSAGIQHAVNANHLVTGELQTTSGRTQQLATSSLALAERGEDRTNSRFLARGSSLASLGGRAVNELRVSFADTNRASTPRVDATSIDVAGAFSGGGAPTRVTHRERRLQVADAVDIVAGRHAIRAGFDTESIIIDRHDRSNQLGTFTFTDLGAFNAGRPLLFVRRVGDPDLHLNQRQAAVYVLDDMPWRRLVFSAGLRQEWQSAIATALNPSPRASVTIALTEDKRTSARIGLGVFHEWYGAETREQAMVLDGTHRRDEVIVSPGFPDPFAARTAASTLSSRIIVDPALQLPSTARMSIGVERDVPTLGRLSANYVRERGSHQLRSLQQARPAADDGGQERILALVADARSTRSSLELRFSSLNLARRISVMSHYIYMRHMSDADTPFDLPADPARLAAEWGPSALDPRHQWFVAFAAGLPKRFELSGGIDASSGLPYDITTGRDDNGDTVINDRPVGVTRNTARAVAVWNADATLSWSVTIGHRKTEPTDGPHVIRATGDMIRGLTPGGGRLRVSFYVQAHNLLNRFNGIADSGVLTSPLFGRPTAALPPRTLQVGARMAF